METPADVLVTTRRSLHAVAELLLAGHQHRVAGTIRLAVEPGGFRTLPLPGQPSLLAVRGTKLVVTRNGQASTVALVGTPIGTPVGTLAEIAAEAGVTAGPPEGVYAKGSRANPADRVSIDPASATTIERALELGDMAMSRFGSRHAPERPSVPVLWPEHFDVGIELDEVNYGVSPGDDEIPEPYAYVGPWTPRRGAFWDRPFGAARLVRDLEGRGVRGGGGGRGADAGGGILEFFEAGRAAAAEDPTDD